MSEPVKNPLLARLMGVYGRPKETEDVNAFMAEYARAMRGYVDSELNEAADLLLAKRKYKTWPSIAECVEAVEDVRLKRRSQTAATKYQEHQRAAATVKTYTEAELREAERFVDDCVAGKIDMGLCARALHRVAIQLQQRRRASHGR